MKVKIPNIILILFSVVLFLIFLVSYIYFVNRKEKEPVLEYESLYFVDDSLVNGDLVLGAMKHFAGSKIKLFVKTKLAEERKAYIWDGEGFLPEYDINTPSIDENYINKNALYRVSVIKNKDKVESIIFSQE